MKYRIVKIAKRYYPQRKFLFWWVDYTSSDGWDLYFDSEEQAQIWLKECNQTPEEIIEYNP